MKFLYKYISPIYFGIAAGKYSRGKYEEAIPYFEKTLKLDPDGNNESLFAYLGKCYLALRQNEKAITYLEKAYTLYSNHNEEFKSEFEINEFEDFLKAYSTALENAGRTERAKETRLELKDYVEKKSQTE